MNVYSNLYVINFAIKEKISRISHLHVVSPPKQILCCIIKLLFLCCTQMQFILSHLTACTTKCQPMVYHTSYVQCRYTCLLIINLTHCTVAQMLTDICSETSFDLRFDDPTELLLELFSSTFHHLFSADRFANLVARFIHFQACV